MGSNGKEFTKLIDMGGFLLRQENHGHLPIEAGGVSPCCPLPAAARLERFPWSTSTAWAARSPKFKWLRSHWWRVGKPMLFIDEKGNMGLMETINNKWVENICRAG